jgi:hypothetical protein
MSSDARSLETLDVVFGRGDGQDAALGSDRGAGAIPFTLAGTAAQNVTLALLATFSPGLRARSTMNVGFHRLRKFSLTASRPSLQMTEM